MIDVVGVRFKKTGKIYYFDPADTGAVTGDNVIVQTARGLEFGKVEIDNKKIPEEEIVNELKEVIRIATEEDELKHLENRNKAREAILVCEDKIKEHNLNMKLINCEYTFDNSKLLFYFTADGRIDFRELVRDLAAIFKTRIELRQIGVRDETKAIGGLSCCGRETCCSSFLSEFSPVSIKMAKDQGLSLNPTKISGICGRLMCCLRYEQEGYECIMKKIPKVGEIVKTEYGVGTVVANYTIQELVKVKFERDKETVHELLDMKEVTRTHKFDPNFVREDSDLSEEEVDIKELESLEKE